MKCAAAWTFFFVGLAFALLGIYAFSISPDLAGRIAYNIATTWQWGWTLTAIT